MIRRLVLVIAMVLSTILPLLPVGEAEAFGGRARWYGYFSNIRDTNGGGCRGAASAGDVMCDGIYPNGVDNNVKTEDFLNQLWADMTYAGGWGAHNQTGAAFIVLTMMGVAPVNPSGDRAALVSQAAGMFWGDFARAVRYYNSRGWVQWDSFASANTQNTYWQGSPGPDDIAWYQSVVASDAILFFNPETGGNYWIRKECANPLGAMNALVLPPANYDVELTATALTSEGGGGAVPYKVVAGKPYSLNATITNLGPATSQPGLLQVLKPGAVCSPNPVTCPLVQGNVPAGGVVYVQSYEPLWPGWSWTTSPLSAPGGNISATMNFTPTGAVGTIFTMEVYFRPSDETNAQAHRTLTYQIVSQRTPGVSGGNADIHAGGGICKQPTGGGVVKGAPGSGSFGQYVVSASAANGINDFKSNGTGADNLRLGQNGAYAQVCRPDLLAAATAYRPVAVGIGTIGGASTTIDLGCLTTVAANCGATTGGAEVYYFDGADLYLSGQINKKVTIVATVGNVHFTANTRIAPGTRPRNSLPSMGVIAKNNINIRAAVAQLDGYLFSNGTINTCVEATTACAGSAANPYLRVNGFLMGQGLTFNRLGQINTNGAQLAEQIVLNPQIYLNPPKLFDASVDDTLLQGQGEKQPLF